MDEHPLGENILKRQPIPKIGRIVAERTKRGKATPLPHVSAMKALLPANMPCGLRRPVRTVWFA